MAPKKSQKMSLGDFLGDQSLGSWADEMEDVPVGDTRTGYSGRPSGTPGGWGTGDRSGGFGDRMTSNFAPREQLPLPTKPPYTAHLGNLSFDATEGDIQNHFSECSVTNVRIVEDKLERKPKGFGYVEFATLDGLKKALELHGSQFQGRNIKISVAEPPKERDQPAREFNDWTRKGPLPDLPNQRRASDKGYNRFNDAGSDAGGERPRRGPPPVDGDGKPRDFGNWERKGPLSPLPQSGPPREGGRGPRGSDLPVRERRQSPAAWGEGGRSESSRGPRRDFSERPQVERPPTAAEQDNQWRSKMKPDAPARSPSATPDVSTPTSPAGTPAAPASRPRLNLQKRTVSEANPSQPASASDSKASPFGAARPIDTAAREQEIEDKRRAAAQQKKEADDKAREEKRAKEAASKSDKDKVASDDKEDSKENGNAGKHYEILRREDDGNDEADDDADAENENANGEIVDDKAVKPKEVVRDPPRKPSGGGSWRKPAAAQEQTAETLDADGWSTVPAAGSRSRGNRRGGNQAARAIAS